MRLNGGANCRADPTATIEYGNMRNGAEAAEMSGAAGQRRYAQAIAKGALTFLGS